MSECECLRSDPAIALRENRSSVVFLNLAREDVLVVHVDGCLVKNFEACDYLVRHSETNYFIELKGSDINKALSQIVTSINELNARYGGSRCIALISSTKAPKIAGFQKAYAAACKVCKALHDVKLSSSGISVRLS